MSRRKVTRDLEFEKFKKNRGLSGLRFYQIYYSGIYCISVSNHYMLGRMSDKLGSAKELKTVKSFYKNILTSNKIVLFDDLETQTFNSYSGFLMYCLITKITGF